MKTFLTSLNLMDAIRLANLKKYNDSAVSRHRLVMAIFPENLGESPRSANSILYRGEQVGNYPRFLIRSKIAPLPLPILQTRTEDFSHLKEGAKVSLRTTVNPVRRNDRKEQLLTNDDEIYQWLEEKLDGSLKNIQIVATRKESIVRSRNPKEFINLHQLDGVATIASPEALARTLIEGFGRSKNYGSGLLTVKVL